MMTKTICGIAASIIAMIALQVSAKEQPMSTRKQERSELLAGNSGGVSGDSLMIASSVSGSSLEAKQTQGKPAPSKKKQASKPPKASSKRAQALIDRNKAAKDRTKRESITSNTSGTPTR